ncbi:hypothetical protein GURASL_00220 [Geotalea uraniireducens]|uniref:DUF2917 domain-containing protein n=1 Tax=Geotalea uraniireducens TaxID=351604 RepID=A0ABN6VML7_9BACT|nr:DUF2917 domain-containing protein [Geotalea uraniireducens]BDV41099.1 hypothetical protein GURASL_00220 [Geotalea uraniireducens]
MTINLDRDETVRLEGDARGAIIACLAGVLWITQEGDATDHLVEAGGQFTVERQGLVLVEARRDAQLAIRGVQLSEAAGPSANRRRSFSPVHRVSIPSGV